MMMPMLRLYNAVGLLGAHGPNGKEAEAEKQSAKISGITFAASKKHSVYAGHLPTYLPTMTYQVEGNRLAAFISLGDLVQTFGDENDVDANNVREEDVYRSFCRTDF